MESRGRLAHLRGELEKNGLDVLLVTHLPNIRYLCGFTGTAGVLAVSPREVAFFTDGRYAEQARAEVRGAKVAVRRSKPAIAATTEWLAGRRSLRRIGIEAHHLTVVERDGISHSLGKGRRLVGARSLVEQMRIVKSPAEIDRIRAACELAARLFERLLEVIRPGVTESEVAGQLELGARRAGAEQMAFPTIVAGGRRSALPHGRASAEPLPGQGFVVCDFGVILAGYCSDMTRTPHVGRPSAQARRAYEAVQEAQQAALEAVKSGRAVGEVDAAARKLLKNRGLGEFFRHSTGHGLGLEIHEAPRVAAGQGEPLRPGMVITVEPGVYLPGQWGVRIEDTVVVTETGCDILTKCSKQLLAV
jgi:Xaa-Pro aminopeptidase